MSEDRRREQSDDSPQQQSDHTGQHQSDERRQQQSDRTGQQQPDERRQQQQNRTGQQQRGGPSRGNRQQHAQQRRQQQPAQQYQQGGQPPQSGYGQSYAGGSGFTKYITFGVGAYLAFALTTMLGLFLYLTLGPESGVAWALPVGENLGGSNNLMFWSVLFAFGFLAVLSPLIAIGTGVFVGREADGQTSAPLAGVASSTPGAAAALAVMIALLFLLAPEGAGEEIGKLIAPVLGLIIGTAAAGAVGGFLGERTRDW